ncbi:MAG: hypothetical protein M3277_06835 [Actinomycetota bacterium]|nr:hypothetical protein [Actinomycetota bacterium]
MNELVANAISIINSPDAGSTELRCWSLLRRLHILSLHLEPGDDQDWVALVDLLKPWSVEGSTRSAIDLRNQLHVLSGEFAQTAAAIDAPALRRRLHGLIDPEAHRSSHAWSRMRMLDQEAREAVQRSLVGSGAHGELKLERDEMRTGLTKALREPEHDLLVHGQSGAGKSAAVLDAIEASALCDESQALVVNLRHIPATPLDFVAALSQPLEQLLSDLTGSQRILVIDAAEASVENRHEVLAYILRAARSSGVKTVAVAAAEGAASVAELMKAGGNDIHEFVIQPLTDKELEVVAGKFPELQRLVQDAKGRELLRRPIVIELLARAGDPGVPLSEAEALDHVWVHLVRNNERGDAGLPDARESAMLKLARYALTGGSLDALLEGLDAAAVAGLRHAGLLRSSGRLPWERVPEFGHDLLRAYAVARHLVASRDPARELEWVGAPRWTLPAGRLACQLLLSSAETEHDTLSRRFEDLQGGFDRLASKGHGERWRDVPTEAMLEIARPLPLVEGAWSVLLADEAAGVQRVFRVLQLRHRPRGILDPIAAEPVISQLINAGTPKGLDDDAADLIRDWLIAHTLKRTGEGNATRVALAEAIVQQCSENERELDRQEAEQRAALAARTPEEVAADEERRKRFAAFVDVGASLRGQHKRRRRRRPYQWIDKASIAHLALLGPDLTHEGAAILRRVAEEEPESLGPAVETPLAGQALADYDPALLVELVEAYYLDNDEDDDDGIGYSGFHEDGIRDHLPDGFGTPLAAYHRGPFIAMLRAAYARGVGCLNRLLNHAAKHRAGILSDLAYDPIRDGDDAAYQHELSITGEPRTYIGDDQVWFWYRGTGVGPYPCMSALQALEVVTDEFIRAGAPLDRLVALLLEGAENLAMPGLVVGVLVRHLEDAGDALDPFIAEPLVWKLEFARAVQDQASMLAARVPTVDRPERRSWSLREACTTLVLRAEGDRVQTLRDLGERLVAAAKREVGDDDSVGAKEYLASVHTWAASLNRAAYELKEHEGQLYVQQTADPEVQSVLAKSNEDLRRTNEALGLTVRHAHPRDNGRPAPEMSREELARDLEIAQALVADPPKTEVGRSPDGPVAVAASAVELHLARGVAVSDADLRWSVSVLVQVASAVQQRPVDPFDVSLFGQGTDRSAARSLPYLLLPAAKNLRASLGIDAPDEAQELVALNMGFARNATNEARRLYASALDVVWVSPCSKDWAGRCHHDVAFDLVEATCRDSAMGPWDKDLQRRSVVSLDLPIAPSLNAVGGDDIIVRRLSPGLRASGSAAVSSACCAPRAREVLDAILAAHRRGMLAHEHGYHHSDSDSLIAARAALWQATDGRDWPVLDHVRAYLGNARVLDEALRAINAAAEERPEAAREARRLWPQVIDQVLDGETTRTGELATRWRGEAVLGSLIPGPAYAFGYLTLEMADEPHQWRDLLAWAPQVDRWTEVASGNRRSIDALVTAVRELEVSDQADQGLKWIEQLVGPGGDHCAWTYTLPEWLRERRGDITTSEQQARWQRIVDVLVVSGDHRLADLAD